MPDRTVDIIVPAYRDFALTKRCIESLLTSSCSLSDRIVVVNDHSPEAELCDWLRQRADAGQIELIENSQNEGFVRSVNKAMALHPDRDAVLVNSDCEVANGWLERLLSAADTDERIGTVTPLSNNATICSYPILGAENPLPAGWSLSELDTLAAQVNPSKPIDLPTAVGSCMFIRRRCWEEVGGFDADVFGHGYGEECDFSMRAAEAGWRNVAAPNVFVFHKGSASFGESRAERIVRAEKLVTERHPDYGTRVERFVEHDPLSPYRLELSLARAERNHHDAQAIARELAQEQSAQRSKLSSSLSFVRKELCIAREANSTLELELDTARAANAELHVALERAEGFVRAREEDVTSLTAERDSISAERDSISAERDHILAELLERRRRSLDYKIRRVFSKLAGIFRNQRDK